MGALTSFVFGMGMTITACYIFLAIVLAPPLVAAGFDPVAVHLFMMYWGMVSFITPPVALASFVAAGAWLLIFQSWRVRVIAQLAAVGVMTIAAHIGGAKVHGDLFKPNDEAVKAAAPKATADRPRVPLG